MARATPSLPDAALALDEHRRRAVGDLPDERHHLLEGGTDADHVALAQQVVQPLLERAVLLDQRSALERLADHAQELGALERLGQEVDRAVLHRADRLLDGPEGRQEDHVHVGRDRLGFLQELEAGQAGHLEVGEQEVDTALAQPVERGLAVGRQDHAVAFARERALEAQAHRLIVVGHEEPRLLRHPRPS